jgi:hypothetical protein
MSLGPRSSGIESTWQFAIGIGEGFHRRRERVPEVPFWAHPPTRGPDHRYSPGSKV